MNLYENSYDCVCTVPYEVRLLAGQFYPEIYSNVTASKLMICNPSLSRGWITINPIIFPFNN